MSGACGAAHAGRLGRRWSVKRRRTGFRNLDRSRTMRNRVIAGLLGAAALAVPAAAVADPGHDKQTPKKVVKGKKAKKTMYVFKGAFAAPDTVEVHSGNAHARKGGFVGQVVTFDFADARIVAAETNADQKIDLADVKDGDLVLVQARMVKGTDYAPAAEGATAEPLVARKLIDKTNAPVEDEEPAGTSAATE
jgi:hypothetical protein